MMQFEQTRGSLAYARDGLENRIAVANALRVLRRLFKPALPNFNSLRS